MKVFDVGMGGISLEFEKRNAETAHKNLPNGFVLCYR